MYLYFYIKSSFQWGSVNVSSTTNFPIGFNVLYQICCSPSNSDGATNAPGGDILIPINKTTSSFRAGSISYWWYKYTMAYIAIGN
ncbi:MAG: hypothetical protein SPF22_07645 [Candidatus Onthovivens sp.]|nr:hypothetical protein [Candidatus Onthovivens sp.]